MDWALGLTLFATSLVAALSALLLLSATLRRRGIIATSVFGDSQGAAVFLFDDDRLIDATADALALLASVRASGSAWQRFLAFSMPRFPGIEDALKDLPRKGRVTLGSADADPITLVAEWRGGLRRITLHDAQAGLQTQMLDSLSLRAQEAELAALRVATDGAPFPIWRLSADGRVVWANNAYVSLAETLAGPDSAMTWPLPAIFPDGAEKERGTVFRTRIDPPGSGVPSWFEIHALHEDAGAERSLYALPADNLVRAEEAQRTFTQTLTKTFAHLPIGLAIFDARRRLQLFNPALMDLAALPVDFLSGRPGLFAFLDALRDRQMIPEPKDYKSWRQSMATLEKTASEGHFEDTWSLPSGLTYRVEGRPHPEGALALMFADISDEISRTRSYRADLELGQSVIDTMEEAIAVFSPAGVMVMSNSAYETLWGHDPAGTLDDAGIAASVRHWRDRSAPDPVWQRAEEFVLRSGDRSPWQAEARLSDGRALRCRFVPLAGGATLTGFAAHALTPAENALPAEASSTMRKLA